MKDGELSNDAPRRYFCTHPVVLRLDDRSRDERTWFRRHSHRVQTWTPIMPALNQLWRWSGSVGVRLELAFLGPEVSWEDSHQLFEVVESTLNPFASYLWFDGPNGLSRALPDRPDVLGVIDLASRFGAYGGRSVTLEGLLN